MGLVTETVEVILSGKNIKYYENLGYEIPRKDNGKIKIKSPLMVRVDDLPTGSSVIVQTMCDCCGKYSTNKYQDYIKQIHNGKTYCYPCSMKILNSGKNNPNYNPNLTDEERQIGRCYPEYNDFIKRVMIRDNYTCQCCGKKSDADIVVHHLYGYTGFPEYRTDQTQALVLCENCHTTFHSWHMQHFGYKNKGNCTREQFEEWYGQAITDLTEYNGVLPPLKRIFDYERNEVFESAQSYANIFDVNVGMVRRCCNHTIKTVKRKNKNGNVTTHISRTNTVKGHHLFWYDEYVKMTDKEIQNYFNFCNNQSHRKVICLNTLEIFNTINSIKNQYPNVPLSCVTSCCKGKRKLAGKLSDGTPLVWMYYKEFLNKTPEEIQEILDLCIEKYKFDKSVICLSTGVKYNNLQDAALFYNVHPDTIRRRCMNKIKHSNIQVPKHWMYYSEFKQLTEEEQNNLLKLYKEE